MKKISQGKYELFTTKSDAIDKFMQLQGVCREKISGESPIEFYCQKTVKSLSLIRQKGILKTKTLLIFSQRL